MHVLTNSTLEREARSKQSELSRMRAIATLLLAGVLVVLVGSSLWAPMYPPLNWVRAFAEAATVGAIADWFAVVALFRHPLGLPIPHTAIIPRNKDRIGRSLGLFVEHNFLTPENIVNRLAQSRIASRLALWLCERANSETAARRMCAAIPPLLTALADEDVLRLLDTSLTPRLEHADAARMAARIVKLLTAEARHQRLIDAALPMIERWLVANREMLTAKFGEMSRYTPHFVDRYIIDRLIAGTLDVLHQVAQNPEHELRRKFDAAVAQFVEDLQHSSKYRAQAEALKHELIAHLKAEEYYRTLWRTGRDKILQDLGCERSLIRDQLTEILMAIGASLAKDDPLQRKLDGWIVRAVETFAVQNRHQISILIEEIVLGWNARDIAEKAELQIGRDLQYIRINGMLVGGLVGIGLYAFSRLL